VNNKNNATGQIPYRKTDSGLDAKFLFYFILVLAYVLFFFCGKVVSEMASRDVVKMLVSEFAKVASFYVSNKLF
jgi:hypothetical protein